MYLFQKSLYTVLAAGTINIPIKNTITEMMLAPTIYGRKKRIYDTPELCIAIISVLLANFDVNQIIERNNKIGNKILAK